MRAKTDQCLASCPGTPAREQLEIRHLFSPGAAPLVVSLIRTRTRAGTNRGHTRGGECRKLEFAINHADIERFATSTNTKLHLTQVSQVSNRSGH